MTLFWNTTSFTMNAVFSVLDMKKNEVITTLTAVGTPDVQLHFAVNLCHQYGVKTIKVTDKSLLHYKDQINTELLTKYEYGQAVEMEYVK